MSSQFYYAPLIWVFVGKLSISRKQKIHFPLLQAVHNSYYDELLLINSDVSIHQCHQHFLVTKVFKSVNNLNPRFMWDYFKLNFFPYDLRRENTLHLPPAHSTHHGINSLLLRGDFSLELPSWRNQGKILY